MQYRDAFEFWAHAAAQHGFGIVLAENSGADPETYADKFALLPPERFSLVSSQPIADDGRGKGALEAALIHNTMTAMDVDPSAAIYKVTGRLTIANPGDVFRPLPPNTAVSRGLLDNTRVDMRCFGASASVWRTVLAGMEADVDERLDIHLGHVVAARLMSAHTSGVLARMRFAARPQIRGSSGTTGRAYGHAINRLSEKFGRALESQLARLARKKSV